MTPQGKTVIVLALLLIIALAMTFKPSANEAPDLSKALDKPIADVKKEIAAAKEVVKDSAAVVGQAKTKVAVERAKYRNIHPQITQISAGGKKQGVVRPAADAENTGINSPQAQKTIPESNLRESAKSADKLPESAPATDPEPLIQSLDELTDAQDDQIEKEEKVIAKQDALAALADVKITELKTENAELRTDNAELKTQVVWGRVAIVLIAVALGAHFLLGAL